MVKEEAIIGFTSGAVYGLTSLIVGHPLDTLKTKMQAQSIHQTGSTFKVFTQTLQKEGIIGLYRGCVPPLIGASVLRSDSVQFGVYEVVYSTLVSTPSYPQDFTFLGVNNKVYIAGCISGAARALVECPLEVAKIRRQIGQTWTVRSLYRGLGVNLARNVPLLAIFFVLLDLSKKVEGIPAQWRPLLTGGICSTIAWTFVWPFDVVKSQVQGSTENQNMLQRFSTHYNKYGLKGFFRGYGPGATRSLIANSLSMVMYVQTKQYLEAQLGSKGHGA